MAKKKKNLRNINTGDTVQFLNYLTPDHILRGKYNTGNNELDITDVPQNLNSVITLGQGGGGGFSPIVHAKFINAGGGGVGTPDLKVDILTYILSHSITGNNVIGYPIDPIADTISVDGVREFDFFVEGEGDYPDYIFKFDINNFFYVDSTTYSGSGNLVINYEPSSMTNIVWSDDAETYMITDPSKDASVTFTIRYDEE